MAKTIKVALAGAGAFGIKHLDGIKNIDGVEVVSLVGRRLEPTQEVAAKYGIAHVATDLADSLALKEVDAVDVLDAVEMLDAECAGAGQRYLDRLRHVSCSPESDGPPRCCWRAHGRSDAAPWACCCRH